MNNHPPREQGCNIVSVSVMIQENDKLTKGYYHFKDKRWYAIKSPNEKTKLYREIRGVKNWVMIDKNVNVEKNLSTPIANLK